MHKPVLVLNANFEPINVSNPRRAISLVLSGKADLVLNGRGVIHHRVAHISRALDYPPGEDGA